MEKRLAPEQIITVVPGAAELVAWHGRWPSFHDAEVISIELHRSGPSRVRVHAFRMTSAVDATGHYVTEKHAVLIFHLADIQNALLEGFNHQNVLDDLEIAHSDGHFELHLADIYGVRGVITSKELSIEFEPGIPKGSVYSRQ